MVRKPDPNQETLIAVNERTGQMEVRDLFAAEEGAVNLIEQKIHLSNCLGHLAAVRMLEGFIAAGPNPAITSQYGEQTEQVLSAADKKRSELRVLASQDFSKAVGRDAMLASDIHPEWRVNHIIYGMFSDFLKKYTMPKQEGWKKSADERRRLEKEITRLQETQTLFNRDHGLRPHKTERKTATISVEADKPSLPDNERDQLDTRERLHAIAGDIRAGFQPRSNGEKNMVLCYLDYLDNPEHPLGVKDQLFEVMGHQQKYRRPTEANPNPKQYGARDAIRTAESIVWEIGDYYLDAQLSLRDLESLKEALLDCFPNALVKDEVGTDHPGIMRLVRHMDIAAFAKSGKIQAPVKDPLEGTNVRIKPSTDRAPGRHKYMHDQYTRPDRKEKRPKLEDYLKDKANTLTIKEARQALTSAITNETLRSFFHRQRLEDFQAISQGISMNQVELVAQDFLRTQPAAYNKAS